MAENAKAVRLRVGRNVQRLRRLQGWSQERLAEAANKDKKHIGQVERGEINVSLDTLIAIADGLSVDVADFFGPAQAAADPPARRVYSMPKRHLQHIERSLEMLRQATETQQARRRTRPK